MKRVAIIIGNEVKMRNYLPGVSKVLSDVGGAWEENEIISSKSWSTSSLKREIDWQKTLGTDYFFIIFSGHDYAIKNNDTFFELAENDDFYGQNTAHYMTTRLLGWKHSIIHL